MAFLVLLTVSIGSLSRVETQIAVNNQTTEKARQHALFALNVALGHLQKTAGPDQRVTARADILDPAITFTPGTTSTLNNTTVKQPLWTGVWKTANPANPSWNLDVDATGNSGSYLRAWSTINSATATTRQRNPNMDWLVSGAHDPIKNTAINPVDWSATATNSVVLAKTKLTPTATATMDTAVPLVAIQTTPQGFTTQQTVGNYAYWIADEGVKAKVNLKDTTLAVNSTAKIAENALHFSAAQANAGHKILPDTLSTDFRGLPAITKVLTPAQLIFVPSTPPKAKLYNISTLLPDITTYSYGVVADVKKGGLKKDLTAALEDTGATAGKNWAKLNSTGFDKVYDLLTDSIPTAPPNGPIGSAISTGLRWNSLYYFYNLYKSTLPTPQNIAAPTPAVGATAPRGISDPQATQVPRPYAISTRVETWKGPTAASSYGSIAPVPIAFQWDVAIQAVPVKPIPTDPDQIKFQLQLCYYPQLTLYNPYGVRLTGTNFQYGKFIQPWGTANGVTISDIYCQVIVTPPAPGVPAVYYAKINQGTGGNRVGLQTAVDPNFAMEPGEIRVYGVSVNRPAGEPPEITIPTKIGLEKNNSMTQACDYTGGLVSNSSFAPLNAVTTDMLYITSLPTAPTDDYGIIPPIPSGHRISIKLTNRPQDFTSSTADPSDAALKGGDSLNSLPESLSWPNKGTNANPNSVLYTMTGANPTIYGTALHSGGFPAISAPTLPTNQDVSTMQGPQSLYLFYVRRKGLVTQGTSATYKNAGIATGAAPAIVNVPVNHGNSGMLNVFIESPTSVNMRYERWDLATYGSYPPTNYSQFSRNSSGVVTTSWGGKSTGVDTPDPVNPSRIVLSDVPIQPLSSLGQFMHMKPYYFANNGGPHFQQFGGMFTGGSIIPPNIETNLNYSTSANNSDDSYLINQTLFDGYFLSTVPPAALPNTQVYPQNWTDFNTVNNGTTLENSSVGFLNTRIVPNLAATSPIELNNLRDMDKAAAKLLLNGAFNINSTSVDAWRALLSSLSGNELSIYDATAQEVVNLTNLRNPIPRFLTATSNNKVNKPWCSIRDLTDDEITELATRIVAQVKKRGPFLSMGDFLNRRLGPNSDLTRVGALQAAIDTTSPDINSTAKAAGTPVPNLNVVFGALANNNRTDGTSGAGAAWNTALGIPGYLMQQDLVQAFSSAMSARSDTFVIRTYGEVLNPAGSTTAPTARAWCEAVVQRLPEYVNTDNAPETALASISPTNQAFGRRFKIVQFRWLNESDL